MVQCLSYLVLQRLKASHVLPDLLHWKLYQHSSNLWCFLRANKHDHKVIDTLTDLGLEVRVLFVHGGQIFLCDQGVSLSVCHWLYHRWVRTIHLTMHRMHLSMHHLLRWHCLLMHLSLLMVMIQPLTTLVSLIHLPVVITMMIAMVVIVIVAVVIITASSLNSIVMVSTAT